MTIQQTIEKAIKGGWRDIDKQNNTQMYVDHILEIEVEIGVFLDPDFWQALGKAMGWDKWDYDYRIQHSELEDMNPKDVDYGFVKNHNYRDFGWLSYWHRFIDHLAEGESPESFFEKL